MRWISLANAARGTCLAFATSVQAQVAEDATVEKAANDELLWLAIVTMVFAVAVALWQVFKVRKAKRRNEHSALRDAADHPPDKRQ